jgi:hypothetical protein
MTLCGKKSRKNHRWVFAMNQSNCTWVFGGIFRGALEKLVPEFYENVGQHLEAFRPKPPQIKPDKPAEEVVPDASPGLQDVAIAANDAAEEALDVVVAGLTTYGHGDNALPTPTQGNRPSADEIDG